MRDLVAHIVDTTEAYFVAFDAARSGGEMDPAYGLPGMAARVDAQAQALRASPAGARRAAAHRSRQDDGDLRGLVRGGLDGLIVSHFYMGPLPAFFYPAFQLMDYGVHSWDVRQGTGRAHGLSGEAADLLTPFMFVLWKYTVAVGDAEPCELGIRITSGPNAGDTRVSVGAGGMDYRPGSVDDLSAVLEFDPGSFVLTAFGRSNARHHSWGPRRGRPVPELVLPDLVVVREGDPPGRVGAVNGGSSPGSAVHRALHPGDR